MRIYRLNVFIAFVLGFVGAVAFAHPMPNTLVQLSIEDGYILGEAQLPVIELESIAGFDLNQNNQEYIKAYFLKHIRAYNADGNWTTQIEHINVEEQVDEFVGIYRELTIRFKMIPINAAHMRKFTFAYDAITHQIVTHKVLVFLKYDWYTGLVEEDAAKPLGIIQLDIPSETIQFLDIDLDEGSFWKGCKSMFLYGMQHIRVGLDHILFLITLLLIAPLTVTQNNWSRFKGFTYTLKRILKISLAFTIGHSLTLLIGSFSFLDVQTQYIEVLIALSILITSIHCIKPIFFKKEILVAAIFGLVHGLAFSFSLAGIDLSLWSKLASILSFNLGIEVMQLCIMLLFSPIILLSLTSTYRYFRIGIASLTILLSLAWIVERAFDMPNVITIYVSQYFA